MMTQNVKEQSPYRSDEPVGEPSAKATLEERVNAFAAANPALALSILVYFCLGCLWLMHPHFALLFGGAGALVALVLMAFTLSDKDLTKYRSLVISFSLPYMFMYALFFRVYGSQ